MKNLMILGLGLAMTAALATAGPTTLTGTSTLLNNVVALTGPIATLSGSWIVYPGETADVAATYTENVYSTGSGDVFAITVTPAATFSSPSHLIEQTSFNGLDGYAVAAAGLTTNALTVNGYSAGGVPNFFYNGGIPQGGASETVYIYTNYAGPLGYSYATLQDGSTYQGQILTPGPEPMSLSLLGGGLALLGALRFRTKRS